ncbi:uncharacterized protein BYT42DRAFT_604256 [Radiomyces spectabilis]|uniref:uncharacterized protein n=1 Tax=Radiomyces spectabilis TaxID=64574 RepID=UPI00221F45FB|nr:uncharacterized protein BYT42DRAFT_604256 [Radiomyces spectabilis]KAI8381266.1 hypothetical protein BYT42DRAFT_604256 [Radiomyces spectabilis]
MTLSNIPPPLLRASPPTTVSSVATIPSPYHHLPPPNIAAKPVPSSSNYGLPPPNVTNDMLYSNAAVLPYPAPPMHHHHHRPPPIMPTLPPPIVTTALTPSPAPIDLTSSPTSASSVAGYRPLNVRDALSYLDQVKIRFADQPDVYNQFLDIMKDFKSQAIDTPGVIERVSILFKGHPVLISGFNTFLPPGYRIECSTDPRHPDLIHVTTPSGTTTTGPSTHFKVEPAPSSQPLVQPSSYYQSPYGQRPALTPVAGFQATPPPPAALVPATTATSSTTMSLHELQQNVSTPATEHGYWPTYTKPSSQSMLPRETDSATKSLAVTQKRPPVEFNHAINYVNKIKSRFANDLDTYKQFLEILQTYQKDQKPITEVYKHVHYLFRNSPDLLDEFKQFLPEITGQTTNDANSDKRRWSTKRASEDDGHHEPYSSTYSKRKKIHGNNGKYQKSDAEEPYAYPALSTMDPVMPSITMEEIELFDKIRKHIGNKPSYEEFLKTLNLYTQQIIDMDGLMNQLKAFLGSNKELFDWFKSIIAYEPNHQIIDHGFNDVPKPDLNECQAIESSASYRILPKEWQNQPCSGRDQMCWEVLNDVYASHPIWEREDAGFVASKKNQYEESLHKCEEDRYDYDLNIEANLTTIALLEPIAERIDKMTLEEKTVFRLEPGLGGETVSIYRRVIKKVYGKERGEEIIGLLYKKPVQVVPVLLRRLKSKHAEWKKAQNEWSKVWRELDSKNYYKSLDYQGLTFKSNDRRTIATKALVAEIEALSQKEKERRLMPSRVNVNPHFRFTLSDTTVIKDIAKLLTSFIQQQRSFSTRRERAQACELIRVMIPLFYRLDDFSTDDLRHTVEEVEEEGDRNEEVNDEEGEEEDDENTSAHTDDSDTDGRSGRRNPDDVKESGLLRDVLLRKKELAASGNRENSPSESRDKSPSSSEEPPNPEVESSATAADISGVKRSSSEATSASRDGREGKENMVDIVSSMLTGALRKHMTQDFFCNTNFYCFFRLYQIVYERLLKMKSIDADIRTNASKGKTVSKVARELGIQCTRFNDIDLSAGHYAALLTLIGRYFEEDGLDQQGFEDGARYIFGIQAYILFSIDKIFQAMIKQIEVILNDTKSVDLMKLFRRHCELESPTPRQLSVYRLRAEEAIGSNEHTYRIQLNINTKTMGIQLLSEEDVDDDADPEDDYESYVTSYMNWSQVTEGIDTTQLTPVYLNRNLKSKSSLSGPVYVHSKLQYKICQNSYHMFYIIGSEDGFMRKKDTSLKTAMDIDQLLPSDQAPSDEASSDQTSLKFTQWVNKANASNTERQKLEEDARQWLQGASTVEE